jgi:thioredoxin-related protein
MVLSSTQNILYRNFAVPKKRNLEMKKIIILFLTVLSSLFVNAQDKGIQFQPLSYEQALIKSKEVNKPVFLFGYANWCHYCEAMKDSVLPLEAVGDFYNKNFVCIKLDLEKEGKQLNQKLRARNFPTMVFFNSDGEMLHRLSGKKDAQDFIQLGKDALDTTKQLRTYIYKYRDGKLTPQQTWDYFKMVDRAGMDNQPLISNYLTLIPEDKLTSATSWRIMYDLFRDIEQPCMKTVMDHREAYAKVYTADSIDNKIIGLYSNALMMKVQMVDTNGYNSIIGKLKASKLDLADKIVAFSDLNRCRLKGQWDEYYKIALEFVDKFAKDDYRRLNDIAFNFSEHCNDRELLSKAEGWAQHAVELMDSYRNNYTLGCVYYRGEKYAQARKALNHAIELAVKNGTDPKQALQLMGKIPQGK